MPMPTATSEDLICTLSKAIEDACEHGDSVTAIAERAGVQRDVVSGIRNRTYRFKPALDRFESICEALGLRISLIKK